MPNNLVIILSPERWGTNKLSKHHYAVELSMRGNNVYFLNPPSKHFKTEKVKANLTIVDYRPLIRGINHLPKLIRDFFALYDIRSIYNKLKIDKLDVVWSFDPYRFQNLNSFNSRIKIYHPVDIHFTDFEFEVANSADLILSVSDGILEKFQGLKQSKIKIGHGLARYFFNDILESKVRGRYDNIKIGLVGNLNSQNIDNEILLKIISQNPGVDFHFVGPTKSNNLSGKDLNSNLIDKLQSNPNCHLLGEVESEELPSFLKKFDAFLICYQKHKVHNPHKILEYLSTGKIIISSYFDEYADKRELLAMEDDNENLPALFERVIGNLDNFNSDTNRMKRMAFAEGNTYDKKLDHIGSIINFPI